MLRRQLPSGCVQCIAWHFKPPIGWHSWKVMKETVTQDCPVLPADAGGTGGIFLEQLPWAWMFEAWDTEEREHKNLALTLCQFDAGSKQMLWKNVIPVVGKVRSCSLHWSVPRGHYLNIYYSCEFWSLFLKKQHFACFTTCLLVCDAWWW